MYNIQNGKAVRYENNRFNDKKILLGDYLQAWLEYFKEGRVHLRKREDNLITAVVDGEELYNVQVRLSEKGVEDCFCTCPYFETMNSVCKHIVSTLKQRQKELDEGADYVDENDKIAKTLCGEFASRKYENSHYMQSLHCT